MSTLCSAVISMTPMRRLGTRETLNEPEVHRSAKGYFGEQMAQALFLALSKAKSKKNKFEGLTAAGEFLLTPTTFPG
jgi:hypothetical protein